MRLLPSRLHTLALLIGALLGFALGQPARAGTPGANGSLTVTAANTVLNLYDVAVSASGRTIVTTNIANLQNAALGNVVPGSVLLVYQAQGATIDASDTATYGNVTAYNGAGYYEFVTVGSVSGNTITLAASCNALAHTYANTAQIVRVPQYATLTIAAGASVTAPAWNGSTGGIVAIDVAGSLALAGTIDVSGDGFRGAVTYLNAGDSYLHVPRVTDDVLAGETGAQLATALGGEKGESIAGAGATYDANFTSRYGRGAPANGGGGGDGHNSGGGGGSNGDDGIPWSGQGLEDVAYDAFYSDANRQNPYGAADPGYANMQADSGGGRGGYSFGFAPSYNVTDDGRRPVGGVGGRPLNYAGGPSARLYFGGGGGAGDANSVQGGSGGNGGGIVLLNAGSVSGGGSILANGRAGGNSVNDGAGGGGGGGAVVVLAQTGSVATIAANGGAGGSESSNNGNLEAEGPGGGGGGGYVAANAANVSVAGASEGANTTSPAVTNGFNAYGATKGAAGASVAGPATVTYCFTPIIGTAKAATVANDGNGSYDVTYSIVLENYGDTPLSNLTASDVLTNTFPAGTTFAVTRQPALVSATAGASATLANAYDGAAATALVTAGTLPVQGVVTIAFTVRIKPPVGPQTYENSALGGGTGTTGNASGIAVTDLSENGTNPDPAGLGNPGSENVPTPITLVGQPALMKTVRNVTKNEAAGLTNDTAVPGNQLEYTLTFANGTGGALSNFTVRDAVPVNTTFKSAGCGALAAGVTACSATVVGGVVTYTLTGTLQDAATQTFVLDVVVN